MSIDLGERGELDQNDIIVVGEEVVQWVPINLVIESQELEAVVKVKRDTAVYLIKHL